MSFSSEIKEELCHQFSKARHCQMAELAAIFAFQGKLVAEKGKGKLVISTENILLAKKTYTLMKKIFAYESGIEIRNTMQGRNRVYEVTVEDEEQVKRILQGIHFMDKEGKFEQKDQLVDGLIVQKDCCKRAFLSAAYIAAGSMSDPEKSYHFELVCPTEGRALQAREILNHFAVTAKIVIRKNHYVVYLKEGEQIVQILNVMGAHKALMELENVRILKEMRNSVNRQVNCETANINKTVNAAVKQIEDIKLIEEKKGLDSLPENLRKMAEVRLENPEATLKELGEVFDPPMGKSGVNHRLRKISEIADGIRSLS